MAAECAFVVAILSIFASSLCYDNTDDAAVWPEDSPHRFGIADPTSEVLSVNFTSKISFKFKTRKGNRIYVMDNLLNTSTLETFRHYLHTDLHGWRFNLHEPYEGDLEKSGDNIPWINELDCHEFEGSLIGRVLQKAVMDVAKNGMAYHPFRVRGKLIRRGDYTKLHTDATSDDDEYSVMVFLNKRWRRNDYGELYLYDDEHEIVAGAVPRFGRVVIWQSSTPYLARPPSIAFKKGQVLLHVQFTQSRDKMLQASSMRQAYTKERQDLYRGGLFPTPSSPVSQHNMASHVVAHHTSAEGRNIFVFDDLFGKEDLDWLRALILKYGTYYYDDSDDDPDSDNVQWIAGFDVDDYAKSSLWNKTHQMIKYASGGISGWFPYDVSCNLIRSADHTRIHEDCSPEETEWTFLLYLTPNWTRNDYGETVFYERNADDTEIITEVRPRYGRAVLFEGHIPHSARPPSTNQTHARLSFAVKMSINEVVARTKAFQEELRHFVGIKMVSHRLESLAQLGGEERSGETPDLTGNEQEKTDQENDGDDNDNNDDDDSEDSPYQPSEEMIAEVENDPEISELNDKLEKILESPDRISNLRALVRDLSNQHQTKRQELVQRLSRLI